MNKKNLFLGLTILLCANQASAGILDSIRSGLGGAAAWVVSWMPESWQGRACVALGVCTVLGAKYYLSRSSSISRKDARDLIEKQVLALEKSGKQMLTFNAFVEQAAKLSDPELRKQARGWSSDELVAVHHYFYKDQDAQHNPKMLSKANQILKIWAEKALGKQIQIEGAAR